MVHVEAPSNTELKFQHLLTAMGFSDAEASELARRLRDGTGTGAAAEVLQRALGASRGQVLDRVVDLLTLQRRVCRMSEAAGHDAEEISSLFEAIVRQALEEAGPDRRDAFEATSQGFAELDGRGRVRSHNSALGRLLGRSSLESETAFTWLDGGDHLAERFEELVSAGGGTIKQRRAKLLCIDKTRRVDLEICVAVGQESSTAYLFVSDSSAHLEAQERAFAAADFGVVRTGAAGEITSCNHHIALRLGGQPEDFIGHRVRDLAADESARNRIDQELKKRQRGEASTFGFKVRVEGAASRRVRVAAFPEFEEDGTTHMETLALVRMIEPEFICKTLHAKMAEVSDVRQRVELLHEHIAPLIPHVSLVFSIFDDSGGWQWPVHVIPRPNPPWATRWFEISETMRNWTLNNRDDFGNVCIKDLQDWHQKLPPGEALKHNPTVKALLDSGIRSSLSVPVASGQKLIASISLMRNSDRPFNEIESSYLAEMRLREIVHELALQYDRQERQFLDELHLEVANALSSTDRGSISSANDRSRRQKVGEYVTHQLCEFYRWRAVEIFEIDLAEKVFVSLATCEWVDDRVVLSPSPGSRAGKPLEEGLLGLAYGNGEIQYHSARAGAKACSADASSKFNCQASHPWAKSAITLPVELKGRVVWIINIEDDRVDAFNEQEQRKLRAFVTGIQSALERLFTESLFSEIFESASDIILVVDEGGQVCFANDRAAMVLQTTRDKLKGQALKDLLVDSDVASRLLGLSGIHGVRCAFRRPNHHPSYVIANAASWQNAFGLKIIYATELEKQSWQADLQVIEGALAEAARQSNDSLMRVNDFIQRLPEIAKNGDLEKETRKVEKHLAKVKLTYDRIRKHLPSDDKRYGWQIDLAQLLLEAAREVARDIDPESWVTFSNCATPCLIEGHRDKLAFVIRSILAYLRCRKADEDHVWVALQSDLSGADVVLEFTAETDPPAPQETDPFAAAFASGTDMVALGTGALRRIIADEQGGRFTQSRRRNDEVEVLTLILPRTAGAHVARREA